MQVVSIARPEPGSASHTTRLSPATGLPPSQSRSRCVPPPPASERLVGCASTMTTVETERLLLRPWCEADLDRLVGLYSNVEVMQFIGGGVPLDRPRVEAMLDRVLRLWRERGFGPWAAIDKASGAWLGEIGLNEIPDWPEADKIEVGWELDPAWWGRGLAPEGGRAALEFGFGVHRLPRIISVTRPDNANSRRVMEKLGLTCQGERPFRGAPAAVWYALDRETWLNSTA
jgi:RimJ/RimL family protein N-acetyltransferase